MYYLDVGDTAIDFTLSDINVRIIHNFHTQSDVKCLYLYNDMTYLN